MYSHAAEVRIQIMAIFSQRDAQTDRLPKTWPRINPQNHIDLDLTARLEQAQGGPIHPPVCSCQSLCPAHSRPTPLRTFHESHTGSIDKSSHAMGPIQPEEYTIVVRGERFVLARDQIFFDSPNYFTMLFTGTFQEAVDGHWEAILHRDPLLFKIIQTYLCGYSILPLPDNWMPAYMSQEAALKNLLEDARFYGLERLVDQLQSVVEGKVVSKNRKAMSSNDEEDEWRIL
jgi:hypothetical protein